jgi:hypothetical protein
VISVQKKLVHEVSNVVERHIVLVGIKKCGQLVQLAVERVFVLEIFIAGRDVTKKLPIKSVHC